MARPPPSCPASPETLLCRWNALIVQIAGRHSPKVKVDNVSDLARVMRVPRTTNRKEPRCRTCRDPQVRQLVNDLLSHGHTYPSILRALEPLNATRPAKCAITKACLWKHCKRHFNLQAPAAAIWRRVLEDRAAESQGAFEDGVASLVNAASYLEVMMRKGYASMVAEDTVISPQDGAWAAIKLHEITKEDSGPEGMAHLQAQLNRIVACMREVVPPVVPGSKITGESRLPG